MKINNIFKSIDDKLKDFGFFKTEETEYGVSYKKNETNFNYIHILDIRRKKNGRHLIQSYQLGVNSDGYNNCVGLTYDEMKLVMKKYKQMKRRYKWI